MSGIGFPNNLNPETTRVLDNRCAGVSTDTNSITFPAQGLLRYETDTDNWKYYDNTNSWVNFSTGVIYTQGEGVTISPSNVISIGQAVDETDDVTFNSVTTNSVKGQNNGDLEFRTITSGIETIRMTITNTGRVGINVAANDIQEDFEIDGNMQLDTGGVQRSRIIFYDKQNDHEHAEVDGLGEGTNGGVLAFYTKVDGGSVTEKLRINNVGAIGIGGATYGNSGQVLISNGSGSSVSWADQTDTTYTQGTGVTISPSNVISIGQSVATSDSPSFNQLSLGVAGTNQGIINFDDFTNVGTDTIAQIKGILDGTNGGQINFFTKVDGGSLTERLIITQSGLVKIKTDGVGLQITSQDGTTEQGYIYNSSFGTKDFVMDAAVGSSADKGILFRTGSGNDRMRIDANGNVGIGTITPSHLLDVNGDIGCTNIISTGAFTDNLTITTDYTNPSNTKLKFSEFGEILIGASQNSGTAGQFLMSNGSGSSVAWATISSALANGTRLGDFTNTGYGGQGTTTRRWEISSFASFTNSTNYDHRLNFSYLPYNANQPTRLAAQCYIGAGFNDRFNVFNRLNFTGQHRCILNTNINNNHLGLIVSTTGKYLNMDNNNKPTINDALPICNLTTLENDKKVFGVISNMEDEERKYSAGAFITLVEKENINENRFYINSVGEGSIWVCNKNGNLENGDYISSSNILGYGQKQILHEDFLTKFTVAKITCDCNFSLNKQIKKKVKTTIVDNEKRLEYDTNGNVIFENDLDENGNLIYEYTYDTRFLDENANILSGKEEYLSRLNNGENVYIACFVGCSYHCG